MWKKIKDKLKRYSVIVKFNLMSSKYLGIRLKNEYPQTIAAIFILFTTKRKVKRILSYMPPNFAREVVRRMMRMEEVDSVAQEVLFDEVNKIADLYHFNYIQHKRRDYYRHLSEDEFMREVEEKAIFEETMGDKAERIFVYRNLKLVPISKNPLKILENVHLFDGMKEHMAKNPAIKKAFDNLVMTTKMTTTEEQNKEYNQGRKDG